jgi:hypothetical protein
LTIFDGQEWERYTSSDGVLTYGIRDIDFSDDGLVWIASQEGVSRFDGSSWSSFYAGDGLADDYAYSVGAGKKGTVWVGHSGEGISYFDGQSWHTSSEAEGLPSGYVKDIAVDTYGKIWAVTYEGAVVWDGSGWKDVTEIASISSNAYYLAVTDDPQDESVWFAGESGLAYHKAGQWEVHQVYDSLKPQAVAVGPAGVWTVGLGDVVFYDGQSITRYEVSDGVSYHSIRDVAVAQDDSVWIAGPGGVVKFTPVE